MRNILNNFDKMGVAIRLNDSQTQRSLTRLLQAQANIDDDSNQIPVGSLCRILLRVRTVLKLHSNILRLLIHSSVNST